MLNFVTSHSLDYAAWEDFQIHRQVIVMIGIVYCPSCDDMKVAHQQDFVAKKEKVKINCTIYIAKRDSKMDI